MLAFLLLSLIWGSTWLFVKIGLAVLPPFMFAGLRFGAAAILLWAVVTLRKSAIPRTWREWRVIVWVGLTGMSINYGLIFWGGKHIPSGLSAVLQAMIPAFGLVLAHYFLPNEKITWRKALGVATGIAGVALIFSNQFHLADTMALAGSAALLTSALVVAGTNIIVKIHGQAIDPIVMAAGQMTVGVIPLFVVGAIWEGNPLHFPWTQTMVLVLLYLVSIGSVVPFTLFYWLIRHMDVTKTMLISLLTPVIAVVLGMIGLGEQLTWQVGVGTLLILAGVGAIVGEQLLAKYWRAVATVQSSG
ncbi:MAG TPA: EamA family transporter [Blastocatellia bacterium]|nr:EamA family transporter [Blastocatellia bacterium]